MKNLYLRNSANFLNINSALIYPPITLSDVSVGETLSPRGRAVIVAMGMGLRRASQLLGGTINKHQSLVNISPAAQSSSLGHGARQVHGRRTPWEGGGRPKGTESNNSAEMRED